MDSLREASVHNQGNPFLSLPNKVLNHILQRTPSEDWVPLQSVCQRMRAIIKDENFWREVGSRMTPPMEFSASPLAQLKAYRASVHGWLRPDTRITSRKLFAGAKLPEKRGLFNVQSVLYAVGKLKSRWGENLIGIFQISEGSRACVKELVVPHGKIQWISSEMLSGEPYIVSASHDDALDNNTLCVWSPLTGQCVQKVVQAPAPTPRSFVGARLVTWDDMPYILGSFITSTSSTIYVWDLPEGQKIRTLEGSDSPIKRMELISLHGRGHIVGICSNSAVHIWDFATGQCIRNLNTELSWVTTQLATIQGTPHLISGSVDCNIYVTDLSTDAPPQTLSGHTEWVHHIETTDNTPWLVSGSSDGTIRLWNLNTSKCTHILEGHRGGVSSVQPVGLAGEVFIVSTSRYDHTICIWDPLHGDCNRIEHRADQHAEPVIVNNRLCIVTKSYSSPDSSTMIWQADPPDKPLGKRPYKSIPEQFMLHDKYQLAW